MSTPRVYRNALISLKGKERVLASLPLRLPQSPSGGKQPLRDILCYPGGSNASHPEASGISVLSYSKLG